MARTPLEALHWLENLIWQCGRCPEDADTALASLRAALEAGDPLMTAADALRHAEWLLRQHSGGSTEAIRHEITQASQCVARARALRG